MYYHAEFGRYALKDVGINAGELPKLENSETLLSWDGRRGRPKTQDALPHMCYNVKFG